MGNKKKSRQTPVEIASAKAEVVLRQLQNTYNNLVNLKTRINDLPSGQFSKIAIAYNKMTSEYGDLFSADDLTFATTEKSDEPDTTDRKTFSEYL